MEKTAISFEYEAPSAEEFARRMAEVMDKYPYLVAEEGDVPLGYAYAAPFAERAAYDWAAEISIYLAWTRRKAGIGGLLYRAMEDILREMNVQNLYAKVAWPENGEDEYLTANSADFHAHLGYRLAGELRCCGYKFGRWYSLRCLEKMLGSHPVPSPPVRSFAEVRAIVRKNTRLREGGAFPPRPGVDRHEA